jgi:hypothetical protein
VSSIRSNRPSEEGRKQFLDLAKMLMTAARQMDDGMSIPLNRENRDTAH